MPTEKKEPSVDTFPLWPSAEILNYSAQCVLLTGIRFTSSDSTTTSAARCSIIKKNGDYYKPVGTCFVVNPFIVHNITLEALKFLITQIPTFCISTL